jgi:aryl-alcohol dehydrogenase-like predicted oxidoreductase
LGRTGLAVTALGLGTAALGVPYGAPGRERPAPDEEIAAETVVAALAAGIRFLDTAPGYGGAERLVGRVAPAGCVVATKLAPPEGGWSGVPDAKVPGIVRRGAEASLRALRRDRLDVLQVHNADPALLERGVVPAALAALRAEGLVTATGATTYGEEAALAAIGCGALDVVQVAHSALDRRCEVRVLPAAEAAGVAIVGRSVLLRGVLSPAGAMLRGPFAPLADAADHFRRRAGASWDGLPGAAVAFARSRPGVASTLLGPRDGAELTAMLAGAAALAGDPRVAHAADALPALPPVLLDPSRWPALEGTA